MIFNGFVTAVISCLTGIGALALVIVLVAVAFVVVTMRRQEKPKQTEPLVVDWEKVLEDVQR